MELLSKKELELKDLENSQPINTAKMRTCVLKRILRAQPRDNFKQINVDMNLDLKDHLSRSQKILSKTGEEWYPVFPKWCRYLQDCHFHYSPRVKGAAGQNGFKRWGCVSSSDGLECPCPEPCPSRATAGAGPLQTDSLAWTAPHWVMGWYCYRSGTRGQNLEPKRIIPEPQGLMLLTD